MQDPLAEAWTTGGSVELQHGALVMRGEVDTHLCQLFRSGPPVLDAVDCLDLRAVTFIGSPGLSLLAEVVRVRGAGVPLWAAPPVLGPLRMTGLDRLFDVRRPEEGRGW